MSNYQFSQSKVIDEITFRKSEGGQLRAYLHAKDGTDPALLRRIIESCAAHDWQCTPANEGGKAVLEVLGGGNEPAVIGFLRERGWVEGAHHYTAGKENKLNVKQQILKRSLAASGAFFVVGDLAFTQYGYAGGDKLNMAAGALYGAGTASLLLLGRKDQSDLQVRDIAKRLDQ